jgi:hypothetical protein
MSIKAVIFLNIFVTDVNTASFQQDGAKPHTNNDALEGKVKIKLSVSCLLTEHHAMKAYWGSGGIAPCFLDPDTIWR